jgi:transcriptional regulator with XRE-family HTH domain
MIERILSILKIKNLTPAQFADMISVQRSSISHLISGRNKPSLEFIQKIITTFPEVNTDWLIFGKGNMILSDPTKEMNVVSSSPDLFGDEVLPEKKAELKKPEIEKIPEIKVQETEKVQKRKQIETDGKKTEKIVYFYKDNTFREYFPEQL